MLLPKEIPWALEEKLIIKINLVENVVGNY